jgi:chorismate mutase
VAVTTVSTELDNPGEAVAPDDSEALSIPLSRDRIDEIDNAIIALWQERAELSAQVGRARMAAGGTRLVLARERVIVERFRTALGADGTALALLILRSGRGPL